MQKLNIATETGTILHGALFAGTKQADTVMIAVTGIHGNFYSNPFYVHLGQTLSAHGIDFVYAQTRNAFNQIPIVNAKTGLSETIGSYNEDFGKAVEDVKAYVDFAQNRAMGGLFWQGILWGRTRSFIIWQRAKTTE